MLKRSFDLVLSIITLVAFSPVMFILAALICIKMGRPVLFKQLRPGYMGTPFYLYKFRTMIDAVDQDGKVLHDGERLTSFGRKLRITSLDELPQLINVLRGEISFVGPRPLLMEYLPKYSPEQARRHEVKPGITGWAQVNGRNAISWEEKFELDIWYVDNHSFCLDTRILWLTLVKVLRAEGISGEGTATMNKFLGTNQGVDLSGSPPNDGK